jgi:hypothetical protein
MQHSRARHAAEGFVLSEDTVGTNGVGTPLEEGRPVGVNGTRSFDATSCAGAPVRHPVTGRLEGVVSLTAGPTRRTRCRWSPPPRATSSAACSTPRRPPSARCSRRSRRSGIARRDQVLCIGENVVPATPAAARLVDGVSQGLLWDRARPGAGHPRRGDPAATHPARGRRADRRRAAQPTPPAPRGPPAPRAAAVAGRRARARRRAPGHARRRSPRRGTCPPTCSPRSPACPPPGCSASRPRRSPARSPGATGTTGRRRGRCGSRAPPCTASSAHTVWTWNTARTEPPTAH